MSVGSRRSSLMRKRRGSSVSWLQKVYSELNRYQAKGNERQQGARSSVRCGCACLSNYFEGTGQRQAKRRTRTATSPLLQLQHRQRSFTVHSLVLEFPPSCMRIIHPYTLARICVLYGGFVTQPCPDVSCITGYLMISRPKIQIRSDGPSQALCFLGLRY